MRTNIFSILFGVTICLISCNSEHNENNLPTSISGLEILDSEHTGIDFSNTLKDDPLSDKNVLSFEYYFNGAGVGIADFNNDGLQDIFFAGNEVPNELYINKGNFSFEKLGNESGINKNKVWSSGVSIVDINNDGYSDIYVCQQGPYNEKDRQNLFYINNRDLTFTESAKGMGLNDPNYSTQAAFFDYDKDGDLDCYVMNESKYAGVILANVYKDLEKEGNLEAASGRLYENTGNLKFVDVTRKAGVLKYGYGLGLNISDFNGDNWPDIYVANDYSVPDFMYINQQNGTFKESVKDYTRQISYFGMGCDVADINNDGLVDIGVVDMAAEDHFRDKTLMAGMDSEGFKYYFHELGYQFQYMFNSLQLNNGNNTFSNIAALAGVLKSDWSWAALFTDLNLDGYKDYYVSNGYRRYARDNDFRIKMAKIRKANGGTVPMNKREELYKLMPEIKLKNKMYINNGNLQFDDNFAKFSHPDYPSYSYGLATADFDNDGDMDLILNNIDQEATLLKNNIRETGGNNFIKITLDHANSAKRLTSKVYVYSEGEIQFQEYYFIRGYESSMEESLIFGLGSRTNIDSIKVIWPDNNIQVLTEINANQTLNIKYSPTGNYESATKQIALFENLDQAELNINYRHTENAFDDFEKEVLLPQKQTAFGPALAVADVNNDGLEDFYAGGAKGQVGTLYIQQGNGSFIQAESQPWKIDAMSEDVDAVFIDPNQDGNLDLLVLSGGSGDFVNEKQFLTDRFYANLGGGRFGKIGNILPDSQTASYSVIAENIDEDPENELLVLGAAKPGKYPLGEKIILYDYYDSKYNDITAELAPALLEENRLTRDAVWVDLNNDNAIDLITVGEWQTVNVYINEDEKLQKKTSNWGIQDKEGWWRSIEKADLDNDGDLDLIAGNVGINFKQKAKKDYPLYLYSNDFDENGTMDIVLAKNYNDKIVPTRGRQCSSEQMPFIKDKFESYTAFASASIKDILGRDKINSGVKLKALDFHSYILWNEGDRFEFQELPILAQAFPVNDIAVADIDKDNNLDIILVGNDYNTEYETPRLDAGNGLVLLNKGNKVFDVLTVMESGMFCPEDAKKVKLINANTDKPSVLVANNNSKLDFLKIK